MPARFMATPSRSAQQMSRDVVQVARKGSLSAAMAENRGILLYGKGPTRREAKFLLPATKRGARRKKKPQLVR